MELTRVRVGGILIEAGGPELDAGHKMTYHEKRASERVPVALRIRLRYQAVDQFISKFAVNISRGGMFLSSRNPKAPGTRVDFEILLADESPAIEGSGEVRWIREYDRRRPDQPHGMGIRFVALSDASWPLLERIIVHRRATGVFDDDGIPEPPLWVRRDPRAPVDDGGDDEPGTAVEDDRIASRLGTVVEAERDDLADDPDDGVDRAGDVDGPRHDDDALDTAEHRIDLGGPADPADHAAYRADPESVSRQVVGDESDVIASVARPNGHAVPTNGAHTARGDDSPDDRLRRELMRALGPSVLMSQAEAAPGREPGRPSEREPDRPSGRPSERQPERPSGRRRTAPPTEPVVRAAMRRARALSSGGAGGLDRELAELLDHSAVPVEISVEAASRELAERLGGAPVQPRHAASRPAAAPATRPGPPAPVDASAQAAPAARSGPPARADASAEAAPDDEPTPTSARRTRGPADVEPSADSHAAGLLRGK